MIQELLGHNDIKTTLIYLHTSNKDLLKIISPLDDLILIWVVFALLMYSSVFLINSLKENTLKNCFGFLVAYISINTDVGRHV